MKTIAIASDKSGFMLKEAVKSFLLEKGYSVDDLGTKSMDAPMPYFEAAPVVAKKVQQGEYEKAILLCGTGAGMAVVANKFRGVYAVACESTYSAEKARAVNNANVLTMGGWMVGELLGCAMAEKFLTTGFTENLEEWRKEFLRGAESKVAELEQQIYG